MTSKRGDWTIESSSVKYENPWIKVVEDKVVRPDGNPGIYGTIKMLSGISVLPIDEEGFVYLVKEFRYAVNRYSIEAASGGMEGEDVPEDTAKRELKEELGIEAKEFIDLGLVDPFTSMINSPATLFLAKDLTFSESNLEGTEQIEMVKMKFEEAMNMVMTGEITHSPSCVLILKANEYLKK
ncbi:NUDIX hydrolase [Candidatus Woesearchaeota archaeon]|jgi:8-oxo-dGTP pyrophosphatase MutT (NUDIX family)|nr:NUDIX hydrolase [Candidatus Woesearchaeota archaeon]MBT3537283.1 NUDIX hydrolase [Candidatus Woesearchaeota archaeon]MBT4696768.1 NUDIX hydrolase [Candidatus Woesearchaeota archaeon]MBT4716751.1 NUDIX hydrolase [Candidatus Woesearchaeota archaeon]MBT7106407.1 NUDIX hydrolase [Candidatus Woesearchaeota archaeon]